MHGYAKEIGGKAYLYYRCRKSYPDYYADRCAAKRLRADEADAKVWHAIKEILKNDRALFQKLETDRAEAKQATRMLQASIAALETQNQQARSKLDRWYDLVGDGLMTKAELTNKKKGVEEEICRREDEIAELRGKMGKYVILSPEQERELRAVRTRIAKGIDNATFEDKQKYVEWLRVECIYDDQTDKLAVAGLFRPKILSIRSIRLPCRNGISR